MFEQFKKNWVMVFGILFFLAVFYAFLSRTLQTSFILFAVMSAIILGTAFFFNKKSVKKYNLEEIKDKSDPVLERFGEATTSGAKIKGIYLTDDTLAINPEGNVWVVVSEGHSNNILLFNAKSGEPFVLELGTEGWKSPLEKPIEKPMSYRPIELKREIKEKVKQLE